MTFHSILNFLGLEEQNESLQKRVFLIFDRACEKIGRKFVIGCIWMAILRTGKVRAAGLKYLMKRIDKLKVKYIC